MKEFGLKRKVQVTYLVEKHNSMIGRFELSHSQLVRAGEGTPLVAEKLTLQEVGGDGGAVDLDELPVPTRGEIVDGTGNQFLAGACLPSDEDRDVDACSLLDNCPHVAHPGAVRAGQLLLKADRVIVVVGAVA